MVVRIKLEDIEGIRNSSVDRGYLLCVLDDEDSYGFMRLDGYMGNNIISSNVAERYKRNTNAGRHEDPEINDGTETSSELEVEAILYFKSDTLELETFHRDILQSLITRGFGGKKGLKHKLMLVSQNNVALYSARQGDGEAVIEKIDTEDVEDFDLVGSAAVSCAQNEVSAYIENRRREIEVKAGSDGTAHEVLGNDYNQF